MKIIPYSDKYFEEVMFLHALNCKEHLAYDKERYAEINEEFTDQGLDIFLAIDGKVIGYIATILSKGIICEMYSLNKSKGIGTELMKFVLKQMQGTIKLKVEPKNVKARKFYKKFGFKELGNLDMIK